MGILRIICFTEMEFIFGLMDLNMLDNSHLTKNTEKVFTNGMTVANFRVGGKEDFDKVKVNIHFKMDIKEKGYGEQTNDSNG